MAGCVADSDHLNSTNQAVLSSDEIQLIFAMSPAERTGTVDFLNDSNTTTAMLDEDCGLYKDAAKWLTKTRPFADIYAAADTKNVGVANLSSTLDCAYEHGYIEGTAEPVTVFYDGFNSTPPTDLQVVIDQLLIETQAEADACLNGCYSGTFSFFEASVTSVGNTVIGATVRLGRVIDPEGGIVESVDFTLDGDYVVIDAFWDAG
jgi:hypothetical protein